MDKLEEIRSKLSLLGGELIINNSFAAIYKDSTSGSLSLYILNKGVSLAEFEDYIITEYLVILLKNNQVESIFTASGKNILPKDGFRYNVCGQNGTYKDEKDSSGNYKCAEIGFNEQMILLKAHHNTIIINMFGDILRIPNDHIDSTYFVIKERGVCQGSWWGPRDKGDQSELIVNPSISDDIRKKYIGNSGEQIGFTIYVKRKPSSVNKTPWREKWFTVTNDLKYIKYYESELPGGVLWNR